MPERILIIAESDSSGNSGIQADSKTVYALGGHVATAITAITAQQNGVIKEFQVIDPLLVVDQMNSVLHARVTTAIKTGALNNSVTVEAVAAAIAANNPQNAPLIIDPSLVGRDGCLLVDETTVAAVKRDLIVRATVLTASLLEAQHLTGMTLRDIDEMRRAAVMLRTLGAEHVVLRAAQVVSQHELYFVAGEDREMIFECPEVPAGKVQAACATLAAAIATLMSQGNDAYVAIERGLDHIYRPLGAVVSRTMDELTGG